jgi:hypothetical protein
MAPIPPATARKWGFGQLRTGFDETKPNHRGICWGFHFMMRDFSIADLSPNPSPFRGGAPENKQARGGDGQPKMKKQTHLMPDFQGFSFSGSPSLKGLAVRSARPHQSHRFAEFSLDPLASLAWRLGSLARDDKVEKREAPELGAVRKPQNKATMPPAAYNPLRVI